MWRGELDVNAERTATSCPITSLAHPSVAPPEEGRFCRLGFEEERRPVPVLVWCSSACIRDVEAGWVGVGVGAAVKCEETEETLPTDT